MARANFVVCFALSVLDIAQYAQIADDAVKIAVEKHVASGHVAVNKLVAVQVCDSARNLIRPARDMLLSLPFILGFRQMVLNRTIDKERSDKRDAAGQQLAVVVAVLAEVRTHAIHLQHVRMAAKLHQRQPLNAGV